MRQLVVVVLVAVGACDPPDSSLCNADDECSNGARCIAGQCNADVTPPGRVTDLRVDAFAATAGSITLLFSAPGDDDFDVGTAAASYTVVVDDERIAISKPPQTAGTLDVVVVEGLVRGRAYRIAIEATDDAGLSSLSDPIESESGGALCNDVDGIPTAVGTTFRVTRPEHLIRLAGCERIDASLQIEDTDCVITSLAPLNALRDATAISIVGNPLCGAGLASLDDLALLERVGAFAVENHGTLGVASLPLLEEGGLSFGQNPVLTTIDLPALVASAQLVLRDNPALETVSLPELASSDGLFIALTEPLALSFPELEAAGDISFAGRLPQLDWPKLTVVDGSISFLQVDDAIDIPTIETIRGGLSVSSGATPSLTLDAVAEGGIFISDVEELAAASTLRTTSSVFVIGTALRTLDVEVQGGSLSIENDPDEENGFGGIAGNPNLTSVTVRGAGDLTIFSSADLEIDVSQYVVRSAFIFGNSAVSSLEVKVGAETTFVEIGNNEGLQEVRIVSDDVARPSLAISATERVVIAAQLELCGSSISASNEIVIEAPSLTVDCTEDAAGFFGATEFFSAPAFRAPGLATTRAAYLPESFFFGDGAIRVASSVVDLPAWSLFIVDQCVQTDRAFAFFSVQQGAQVSLTTPSIAHPGCNPAPVPLQFQ